MTAKKSTQKPSEEARFTRGQLMRCKRFSAKQDILLSVLDGSKTYTMEEADKLVSDFLKGKVK